MGLFKDALEGLVTADADRRTREARASVPRSLVRLTDKALLLLRSGRIDRENLSPLAGLVKYDEDALMDMYEMPLFAISPDRGEEQGLRALAQAAAAICTHMNSESDDEDAGEYTWSDFDAEVRDWLEDSTGGRALVLDTKVRGRYVQIRRERERFLLETSNDESNGGSASLTMKEYNDLLNMGWRTPLAGAEYPNSWFAIEFGRPGPTEQHYDAVRMVFKRTLMDGFGVDDPGILLDT